MTPGRGRTAAGYLSSLAGLIAIVLTSVDCVAQPGPGPAAAPSIPPAASATTADLIASVPPAGLELSPDSRGWGEHPAATELRRRIIQTGLTDAEWAELLLRTRAIYTRSKWPVHKPLAVGMMCPTWL